MNQDQIIHRAYSTLEIKAAADDDQTFYGIASTPTLDSQGDVMIPEGAEYTLPLPLLWQHNAKEPVGHVTAARITDKGIEVTAKILRIKEAGRLKDRLDEAYQSIKYGLVRGLSIGFRGLQAEPIKAGGRKYIRWKLLELSAVTIPANQECNVLAVKAADQEYLPPAELRILPVSNAERLVMPVVRL
jgi:HK97 family phage prohead protease